MGTAWWYSTAKRSSKENNQKCIEKDTWTFGKQQSWIIQKEDEPGIWELGRVNNSKKVGALVSLEEVDSIKIEGSLKCMIR